MNKLTMLACLLGMSLMSFAFNDKDPSKKNPSVELSQSLAFPVWGKKSSIGSFWGDERGGGKRKHRGIDIFARKGTPVVALTDGVIIERGNTPRGGKTLWLQSVSQPWIVYYAHLDQQKVRKGQYVKKGDIIGTVGNTGNAKTTPAHLHFGIYTWAGAVNPLPYVKHSPRVVATKKPVAIKTSSKK